MYYLYVFLLILIFRLLYIEYSMENIWYTFNTLFYILIYDVDIFSIFKVMTYSFILYAIRSISNLNKPYGNVGGKFDS